MQYIFQKEVIGGPLLIGAIYKSRAAALRQVPPYSLERHFIKKATVGSRLELANGSTINIIKVIP